MTILATDNYVRADNTDLGTAWDPCTGDGSANGFKIVSNTAQPNSPSNTSDVSETNNSATFPNDQYCEVKFNATAADGVGTGSGAMCRAATGATVTRYRAIGSASGYELLRFVTGTPTSLSSGAGTTFAAGDKLRLDVQTNGSNCNWSLKKNGVQFASGTDTSPIASGRAGIAYSSTSSSQANAALSGFEAGDIPSGGTWSAGSEHPGQSPGLASAGSARFQTNWWPYSPPALVTTGVISATQDDNTAAFTAAETIPGSIGATQGNATASFIASEIISGRLSAAQADNVAAITGRETVVVLLSSTQANNTASFSGTLLVSGVINASQADNVATIAGRETVTLVLGPTQDSNTANISAVSGVVDSGAIQATQDDNVSTLAGAISDSGALSASQDNNVAAFSGGSPVEPVVPVTTVAQPGIAFIGTGKEDASFSGGHDIKKRRKEEQEVMAIIQTFIHSRHFDHRV